jgi:transcription elongation factor Elf1
MPNGWDLPGRTIASLQRGESLEFKCGICGRRGRVSVTELRFRRVPYTLPIAQMVARVVCKRCGKKSAKTKVWAWSR